AYTPAGTVLSFSQFAMVVSVTLNFRAKSFWYKPLSNLAFFMRSPNVFTGKLSEIDVFIVKIKALAIFSNLVNVRLSLRILQRPQKSLPLLYHSDRALYR
ncbi:MAG: hypothetical protein WC658_04605, partial [Candidatus Omnitrophota bacterium]